MKVYIEFFIIDNLVVTSAIVWLSYSFFGMRVRMTRGAVAALAGLAASAAYPYADLPRYFTVSVKLAEGVLLSGILFYGLKKAAPSVAAFFVSTALIGGACYAASCAVDGGTLPYLVPSVISVCVAAPVKFLICEARKRYAAMRFVCDADVVVGEKRARLRGFIDSGNALTDGGIPVAVIKMSSFAAAFGTDGLTESTERKFARALGGGEKLILVKPCKIRLYYGEKPNKYKDVTLGVSALGFNREEDILLPSSVIGG